MAFTRTAAGLNNQHLFYNVDYIVFVEGGQSFTRQEIDQGHFNELTIDVLFWRKIFEHFKPARYKFKAVGSKSAVKKVAEDIIDKNLQTVFAAMDQEFDMVSNLNLNHPNVIYTMGYSWENDAWNENVIASILSNLSASNTDVNLISGYVENFIKSAKTCVYADGYLFTKTSSFFPRPGHMKLFVNNSQQPPAFKKSELDRIYDSIAYPKTSFYSYGSRKKLNVRKHCYGHLFGDYCKNLTKFLLRSLHTLTGIADEMLRRSAISNFINFLPADVTSHYVSKLQ